MIYAILIIFAAYALYLSIKVTSVHIFIYDGLTVGEAILVFIWIASSILPFWNILIIIASIEFLHEENIDFLDAGKIKEWSFLKKKLLKP
jgi:hypothetical protein